MNAPKPRGRGPGRPWVKGQSGNPAGGKAGSGVVARLRASIGEHLPEIITRLVAQAREGDVQAARLLLERVCPPLKGVEQPAPIALPADAGLAEQAKAIVIAAGAGELAPGQASMLVSALAGVGKLVETEELEARITAIEERGKPA